MCWIQDIARDKYRLDITHLSNHLSIGISYIDNLFSILHNFSLQCLYLFTRLTEIVCIGRYQLFTGSIT